MNSVKHDRAWIAAHIPHQGDMCLLDEVLSFDEHHITCLTNTHRRQAHPLAHAGRLGAAVGIEYAAQAMAVHGAVLSGGGPGRGGYLTSVRDARWAVERLDDIDGPLEVHAQRLSGDDNNVLYAFSVRAQGKELMSGRTTVILRADH